jgi:hypothetical protein
MKKNKESKENAVFTCLLHFSRFLFESDHHRFLPTISLQHGPVELGLMWPEAAMGVPKYSQVCILL